MSPPHSQRSILGIEKSVNMVQEIDFRVIGRRTKQTGDEENKEMRRAHSFKTYLPKCCYLQNLNIEGLVCFENEILHHNSYTEKPVILYICTSFHLQATYFT